jgi:hypothetical protein
MILLLTKLQAIDLEPLIIRVGSPKADAKNKEELHAIREGGTACIITESAKRLEVTRSPNEEHDFVIVVEDPLPARVARVASLLMGFGVHSLTPVELDGQPMKLIQAVNHVSLRPAYNFAA